MTKYFVNTVLKGKYKGCEIKNGEIIYDGYYKCKLSAENIVSYTIIDRSPFQYSSGGSIYLYDIIQIEWKDGEKSLIYIDDSNYLEFIVAMH